MTSHYLTVVTAVSIVWKVQSGKITFVKIVKNLFVRLKPAVSAKNVLIAVKVNPIAQNIGASKMTDMKNTSAKIAEIVSIIMNSAKLVLMQGNCVAQTVVSIRLQSKVVIAEISV